MKKSKTFYDIVEHSGVSIATVSRYFNNRDIVSEKSQKKIKDAIKKLGYQENKFAKTLATGQSDLIGIILPNLKMDFYNNLLSEIMIYAQSLNLNLLVFNSNEDIQKEMEYINKLHSYQVIGIINYSHAIESRKLSKLHPNIVVIERSYDSLKAVSSDNENGGKLAFEHLIDTGCDILINLNTPDDGSPVYNRTRKFLQLCKEHNSEYEFIEYNFNIKDYTQNIETANEIIEYCLNKYPNKKLGFFCGNDSMATTFKNEVINKNIDIPNSFSIIGFDDSPISYRSSLPMTTIKQDIPKIAKNAVDLLFVEDTQHKLINVELVKRSTT